MSKWIRVEDALPRQGRRVLAYTIEDDKFPWLDSDYFEANQYDGSWQECVNWCDIHVTHWMPLPASPDEETIKIIEDERLSYIRKVEGELNAWISSNMGSYPLEVILCAMANLIIRKLIK